MRPGAYSVPARACCLREQAWGPRRGWCAGAGSAQQREIPRCMHPGCGRTQQRRQAVALPELRVDGAQLLVQALQLLLAPPRADACTRGVACGVGGV